MTQQLLEKKDQKQWRILERDGKFNIAPKGVKGFDFKDLYYHFVSASWPKFFGAVLGCYLFINLCFAAAYFFCGAEALAGIPPEASGARFLDCFFFSVQTLSTIGYGHISPANFSTNCLVTLEALAGLLSVGLMTGLLFSRFSRSTAKVVFSDHAIMTSENGKPCFTFRLANQRLNQITEAKLHVTLVKTETNREGESFRRMTNVPMDRDHSPLFLMSWTVLHTIDEKSPLYGMTDEKLRESEAEILVSLSGIDNAFSQPIHARFSYTAEDILWAGRFVDILNRENGKVRVDLKRIHDRQ